MTVRVVDGQREWKLSRGEDGHRTYTIVHIVEHEVGDLGFTILNCPDLPQEGDEWNFDNDSDPWAFCMPTATVEKMDSVKDGHPHRFSKVTQTFSSKQPDPTKQRCSEIKVEDPLLEPPKITFSFTKYTEEATQDRFGNPIVSSSHEQIRGPQNEWDANRFVVKIEQNVAGALQGYQLPVAMKDMLNDAPLWGYARRCIKMTPVSGERRFYGHCNVYYNRVLEFEVRPEGFDRDILDEGSKLLHGHWGPNGGWVLDEIDGELPDPNNPTHFDKAVDKNGNPMRVILDGLGQPAETTGGTIFVSVTIDNLGQDLENLNYWYPLNLLTPRISDTPPDWANDVAYPLGGVVAHAGEIWLGALPTETPNVAFEPGVVTEAWILLPNGLIDMGEYNVGIPYFVGEYVTDGGVAAAGQIHVEKYFERNLLLLGIPSTF